MKGSEITDVMFNALRIRMIYLGFRSGAEMSKYASGLVSSGSIYIIFTSSIYITVCNGIDYWMSRIALENSLFTF